MKILIIEDKQNKLKIFKKSHPPGSRGPKVILDIFFDCRYLAEFFFAFSSLSTEKYFKKKKVRKKSNHSFLHVIFKTYTLPGYVRKLGGQDSYLGLHSIHF
jgi:hypothetical protein